MLLFVDFSKAFDSVNRLKMMKILKAYGIPGQLIEAIAKLYMDTRARILSPDGETEFFKILAGVLQGDTLAPYLFTIVIDYIMRLTIEDKSSQLGFTLHPRRSRRIHSVDVTDLCFADDIALLCNELCQANELLQRLETEARKVGLRVNAKKTELMAFNQESETDVTSINGNHIKKVDNFKYLGGWLESSEKDVKIRIAKAWSVCHRLSKVWKSNLSRKIKVRIFVATVESVLLYNCNTWTLTKQLEKSIDGTYTRMLRMALNISWQQHMTNEQLYDDLPPVTSKITTRRLKLAGHCVRHKEEVSSNLVLWQPLHGYTKRGRKKKNFIDVLKDDTGLESIDELKSVMLNRQCWKMIAQDARPGGRPK